jgi:hypothetical protein
LQNSNLIKINFSDAPQKKMEIDQRGKGRSTGVGITFLGLGDGDGMGEVYQGGLCGTTRKWIST